MPKTVLTKTGFRCEVCGLVFSGDWLTFNRAAHEKADCEPPK